MAAPPRDGAGPPPAHRQLRPRPRLRRRPGRGRQGAHPLPAGRRGRPAPAPVRLHRGLDQAPQRHRLRRDHPRAGAHLQRALRPGRRQPDRDRLPGDALLQRPAAGHVQPQAGAQRRAPPGAGPRPGPQRRPPAAGAGRPGALDRGGRAGQPRHAGPSRERPSSPPAPCTGCRSSPAGPCWPPSPKGGRGGPCGRPPGRRCTSGSTPATAARIHNATYWALFDRAVLWLLGRDPTPVAIPGA